MQIAYNLLQEILAIREDLGIPRKAEHEENLSEEQLDKLLPLPKINLVTTQGKDDLHQIRLDKKSCFT